MSRQREPVTIRIMEREFTINCTPDERESLLDAARYLDLRMRDSRDRGPNLSYEKIAIMTALNLCHSLLDKERELKQRRDEIDTRVARLTEKLDRQLEEGA